jgi:hypothetical protein
VNRNLQGLNLRPEVASSVKTQDTGLKDASGKPSEEPDRIEFVAPISKAADENSDAYLFG